jgi:tetratricopeptide (TPR) repeat protein
VACATLPYLNILFNGFVYDDDNQVLKNPYLRNFHFLKEIFTTNVWSFEGVSAVTNYYRPMMTLGYLVCNQLFGMQAYGFHLFSLLLHVLVVCLVFVLAERLTGDRLWAFAAGALFALHPAHTESVAWIAADTDLELTLFYLLAFGLFQAAARPQGGHSKPLLAAMGGAFLLALLSKEPAITLPALATVYEHFYRPDRSETSTHQKMARYGLLWLVAGAYVLFRIHFLGALAPHKGFPELISQEIVFSAIALVGQYAGKFLWPVRLCAYYVFHPSSSLFDFRVLAGLLVILALAALFLVCWRSHERNLRFASFGILWFFATLFPVLNPQMLGANVFTERYIYLPSVGLAWLFGLLASRLWRRTQARPAGRRALLVASIALAGLFAARIVTRNRDWNNDIALYTQTLAVSPDADVILDNLALAFRHQGDEAKAESAWRRVLALHPDDPPALNNLGLIALQRHQYAEAVELFQRVIAVNSTLMNPHLNLGMTYAEMGLVAQAESELRAAVALSPLSIQPHNRLGQLLVKQGRSDEAEEQFRACIGLAPSAETFDFLGMINIRRRAWEAAEHAFRAALSLDESDSNAHFGLGYVCKATGRTTEALSQYQAGLVGDPTNASALAEVQELRQQSARTPP